MAKHGAILFFYVFPTLILSLSFLCKDIDENRTVHIVYLGSLPDKYTNVSPPWFTPKSCREQLREFYILEQQDLGTLLVSTRIKWNGSVESDTDTIIGVIDSGIWLESESFKDESFGPPPKKWKGGCAGGTNFTCNKKLIGARFYNFSFVRDEQGHGTHTALMVAGITVHDVSFYGLAQGTATGGVPSARIAAYKVCNAEGCSTEAILATFDDAIADGVDIITISINSPSVVAFEKDPISIGAFHAMEKGILTTNSVGNGGPFDGSVASVAPWMLTVAASTIDRRIIDKVILGNGKTLVVALVNSFTLNGTSFPLIYGNGASSRCSNFSTRTCMDGFLDSDLVKGKVLLCDESDGANGAFLSGAVGSIMKVDWDDYSLVPPLPATSLSLNNRNVIKSYITPRKILE
ncbi:subtilisin-like protease SBT4.3 [Rosa chinensis]|uniref:subtilisin-like protease SBT4.3 n=1 Tax=Rosa chinensis TaxID=74649 RepID=UPI000D089F49|nr:subtilisin-like protease SBT4.3 [Rosa chinensis]